MESYFRQCSWHCLYLLCVSKRVLRHLFCNGKSKGRRTAQPFTAGVVFYPVDFRPPETFRLNGTSFSSTLRRPLHYSFDKILCSQKHCAV